MALTLNSNHPLAEYLEILMCVDDVATDLTGNITLTPHEDTSYGSGHYGRHIQTEIVSGNSIGVNMSPGISLFTSSSSKKTCFVVLNNLDSRSGRGHFLAQVTGSLIPIITVGGNISAWHSNTTTNAAPSTSEVLDNGPFSFAVSYNATSDLLAVYVNGAKEASVTHSLGGGPVSGRPSNIGGSISNGYGSVQGKFVWFALFNKELTETEIADLHNSLGANNAFSLIEGSGGEPPLASPVLTSAGASATGQTTASASVTTDKSGGTLYWLVNESSSATSTQVKGGQSVAVTSSGALNVAITGLSPSSTYYVHFLHRSSDEQDSTVLSSPPFTTFSQTGDTTPPTLSGAVTFSAVTKTQFSASWPVASDDTGVTGYEYQLNGASSWINNGASRSVTITNQTPGTTRTVHVRAFDAAGNRSEAIQGVVTLESELPSSGLLVSEVLKNNTGAVHANLSNVGYALVNVNDFEFDASTDAGGKLSLITSPKVVSGQTYHVVIKLPTGQLGITGTITAP